MIGKVWILTEDELRGMAIGVASRILEEAAYIENVEIEDLIEDEDEDIDYTDDEIRAIGNLIKEKVVIAILE